ncbi:YceI family protein [Ideonella sp. BN130291]|uniref:YceI family protein n=1 Tax=Ideonella sp. BN130291 TaxID=3112940 RepID=UPI002E2653F3|nr:YceI family protein [Ideonella sp. BN130291]
MKSFTLAAVAAALLATGIAHAEPATYAIDPTHTSVMFEMPHFGTSTVRGRWQAKEGSVQFDKAAKTGKVDLTLDTNAVNSGVPALDKHLQGADFFDTAKFPTAKFAADKFSFNGDKVTEVAGTLTMMGKTHPVTLKATNFNCYQSPMLKREVCGGDFETTIQRSQWGVSWGLNYGFPDAVHLLVQVEAVKQ